MTYYFVEFEKNHHQGDNLITLDRVPNWFERLFGYKTKRLQYIGRSTVWYTYPSFKRASFSMDYMLHEINKEQEYIYTRKQNGKVEF